MLIEKAELLLLNAVVIPQVYLQVISKDKQEI
jgi:hypothetical protein